MSPASVFTNGRSALGGSTPVTADTQTDTASLWTRLEQIIQNDNEKTTLLKEIMCRYDYLSQEYQRELDERAAERNAIITWQRDKQHFESTFRSMQIAFERNPFVIILIDGDGMIFQDEFVRDGERGGRRAAAQLQTAITNYVQRETNDIPTEVRIVCRIYANVRGLAEVLVRTGVVEEISPVEEFVRGFTRGKTLFDFVDVGPGKDRADEKLIETFKLYSNDFHCRHIFLGCSHDNGYARTLEDHATDQAYLSKVTLMEGVPFEKELLALPYNTKKFPGIFREKKLVVFGAAITPGATGLNGGEYKTPPVARNFNIIGGLPSRFPPPSRQTSQNLLLDSPVQGVATPNIPRTPSTSSFVSNEGFVAAKSVPMNWAAKAAQPPPPVTESPVYKPANREEVIARNRSGQRVDPPCRDYDKAEVDRMKKIKMCNVHFLRDECPYGSNCTHLHNYKPTKDEIATLRLVARMAPCQNGSGCQDIKCMYGHRCPAPRSERGVKGTKSCIFGEQCKFPPELHDIDCTVVKTLIIR